MPHGRLRISVDRASTRGWLPRRRTAPGTTTRKNEKGAGVNASPSLITLDSVCASAPNTGEKIPSRTANGKPRFAAAVDAGQGRRQPSCGRPRGLAIDQVRGDHVLDRDADGLEQRDLAPRLRPGRVPAIASPSSVGSRPTR